MSVRARRSTMYRALLVQRRFADEWPNPSYFTTSPSTVARYAIYGECRPTKHCTSMTRPTPWSCMAYNNFGSWVCHLNGVIGVSVLRPPRIVNLLTSRLRYFHSVAVCRASGSYMYILHIPNQWIGIERGAGRRPYSNAPRDPIHGVTSPLVKTYRLQLERWMRPPSLQDTRQFRRKISALQKIGVAKHSKALYRPISRWRIQSFAWR